jgi:hypothetical protein
MVMMMLMVVVMMMMMVDALASNDPVVVMIDPLWRFPHPDPSWRSGFGVFWWLHVSLLRFDFTG